jgi:hypothetical protein
MSTELKKKKKEEKEGKQKKKGKSEEVRKLTLWLSLVSSVFYRSKPTHCPKWKEKNCAQQAKSGAGGKEATWLLLAGSRSPQTGHQVFQNEAQERGMKQLSYLSVYSLFYKSKKVFFNLNGQVRDMRRAQGRNFCQNGAFVDFLAHSHSQSRHNRGSAFCPQRPEMLPTNLFVCFFFFFTECCYF